MEEAELEKKRTDLHERYKSFGLYLNGDLSMTQLNAIDTLLLNMKELRHDTMWISKFEFTVGQWYEINDEDYDKSQRMMPMTDVSFGDICMFLLKLSNVTNLDGAKYKIFFRFQRSSGIGGCCRGWRSCYNEDSRNEQFRFG